MTREQIIEKLGQTEKERDEALMGALQSNGKANSAERALARCLPALIHMERKIGCALGIVRAHFNPHTSAGMAVTTGVEEDRPALLGLPRDEGDIVDPQRIATCEKCGTDIFAAEDLQFDVEESTYCTECYEKLPTIRQELAMEAAERTDFLGTQCAGEELNHSQCIAELQHRVAEVNAAQNDEQKKNMLLALMSVALDWATRIEVDNAG